MDDAELTKACRKCGEEKRLPLFPPNRKCRDGRSSYCRTCHGVYARKWRAENREYLCERKRVARASAAWPSCRMKETPAASEKRRARQRGEYRHCVKTRLKRSIRSSLSRSIKRKKEDARTFDILGYSLCDLMGHIERQFQAGMSWSNYGDWHIDHIVPVSAVEVTGKNDPALQRVWALSNLMPLWAKENISKGAKRTYLI